MDETKILVPNVRMYVDENGHQSLKGDLSLSDKRFLCMTGVIMPIREHNEKLTPMLNDLKIKYFGSSEIVLHRRELISAKGPFTVLSDKNTRQHFDDDLLFIIAEVKYRVISVVIDKKRLVEKHGILHAHDPYALALEYLMQRYQYWMKDCHMSHHFCYGDILAESRGGGEDLLTKRTYDEIYQGKGYNPLDDAAKYYSSSHIKLKKKADNIAGLQFVDLISHPARRYILSKNDLATNLKTSSFEQRIVEILSAEKFRRKGGKIEGAGTVFYPK